MFQLHPQLKADTLIVTDLALCRVLLMNNALFPWLVLVPKLDEAREILDLTQGQRHLLMDEIAHICETMQDIFKPQKLNVAALGNQVPQLHVHVIARFLADAAWPNPVWGKGGEPYGDARPVLENLKRRLAGQ